VNDPYPQRIVCLTEEPTETLYALGESDRIVGISGFTVRPPEARRDKPKVSAFTSARLDRILALQPDLAIGFSDIQADIAQALVKAGVEVWISNHRSVEGILGYILRLGAMVGAADKAAAYVGRARAHIDAVCAEAAKLPRRPKVYFEEWADHRHPLGGRAGAHRRRRRHLPAACAKAVGEGSHPGRSSGGRAARARHRHRFMVRQALPP
jgi:iron complex transport system substrate-binding protein